MLPLRGSLCLSPRLNDEREPDSTNERTVSGGIWTNERSPPCLQIREGRVSARARPRCLGQLPGREDGGTREECRESCDGQTGRSEPGPPAAIHRITGCLISLFFYNLWRFKLPGYSDLRKIRILCKNTCRCIVPPWEAGGSDHIKMSDLASSDANIHRSKKMSTRSLSP